MLLRTTHNGSSHQLRIEKQKTDRERERERDNHSGGANFLWQSYGIQHLTSLAQKHIIITHTAVKTVASLGRIIHLLTTTTSYFSMTLINCQYYAVLSTSALILSVGAMQLTRYELSLLQKCNTVDDCVAVNYGVCDCANGGGLYGINKDSVSAFEATFPTNQGCTEIGSINPCDEGTLSCTEERGLCLWERDRDDSPLTCQQSPQRPTASPDALTELELEPLRQCVDDLQCVVVTNKFSRDQNMIGEEIAINSAKSESFRAAFNQTTTNGAVFAESTPYIWRIGTTKCDEGNCVHIPASLCDEINTSDSDGTLASIGTKKKVLASAFTMLGAIGGGLLLVAR
mmetsp:Transcript_15518/g.23546  ORF Transcript_15518/g.23546 Transcript_15518/m.23546 type:complete len:343 (+) Transcript_15518:129-1157(+)